MSISFPLPSLEKENKTYTYTLPTLCSEIQSVSIIGTGNVAHWFVYTLKKAGIKIHQIYGRDAKRCQILAESCGAEAINDLSKLKKNSDLYLFSIKDDSYEEVVSQIPFELPLAALTSGTVSQRVLAPIASRFGTIYPCQTLNCGMDFSEVEVPLCVEGGDGETEALLLQLAAQLSEKTLILHEEERRQLHLAAVFACNFTNALYGVAFDLLKNAKIEPTVLLPLLQNSLKKLNTMTPEEAQTGPAVRGDKKVIEKHLSMIQDPQQRAIYELLTEEIAQKSLKKA